MGTQVAEQVRHLIDRGLARYGRGQLQEALSAWDEALALDAANTEAQTLIDFVKRKLQDESDAADPDRRNTEPVIPTFNNDWGDPSLPDTALTSVPDDLASEDGPTTEHVRRPTVESSIPQLLAQITAPEWEAPAEREEGAPEALLFGDETRRLGSDTYGGSGSVRVPVTARAPTQDSATQARLIASELVDRCRTLFERGDISGAVTAAESALREAERAPHPGISEVIEPARPLFERVFEAFIGPSEGVPMVDMSDGALASQGLDHRAGFLLSRIDGLITIEHLLDIAGMSRFEALAILASLLRAKTIRIQSPI